MGSLKSSSFTIRPSVKPVLPIYAIAALTAVLPAAFAQELWTPTALLVPLAIALYGAYKQFMLRRESLSVEAGSLRYAAGLLSRSTRTMELRKVQDVRVDQTLGQRLIGTGDLSIETAGESGRLTMRNVDHPQSVAEAILQAAQGDVRAATSK